MRDYSLLDAFVFLERKLYIFGVNNILSDFEYYKKPNYRFLVKQKPIHIMLNFIDNSVLILCFVKCLNILFCYKTLQ